MPWEISIIKGSRDKPVPLGSREEVIAALSEALPGVLLERPPVPPTEFLEQMPAIVREAMLRPRLEGDFDAKDFSIQFYANDEAVIMWINGEIRGNGNPIPALAALCLKRGWSVISAIDKSIVDLSEPDQSPAWEWFKNFRDKAINEISVDS